MFEFCIKNERDVDDMNKSLEEEYLKKLRPPVPPSGRWLGPSSTILFNPPTAMPSYYAAARTIQPTESPAIPPPSVAARQKDNGSLGLSRTHATQSPHLFGNSKSAAQMLEEKYRKISEANEREIEELTATLKRQQEEKEKIFNELTKLRQKRKRTGVEPNFITTERNTEDTDLWVSCNVPATNAHNPSSTPKQLYDIISFNLKK